MNRLTHLPIFDKADGIEALKVGGVNFAAFAVSIAPVEEFFKFIALVAAAVYTTCKAIGAVMWLCHRYQRWRRGDKMDIGFKCPITGKDACPERFPAGPEKSEADQ